jgi:hypothetical protein
MGPLPDKGKVKPWEGNGVEGRFPQDPPTGVMTPQRRRLLDFICMGRLGERAWSFWGIGETGMPKVGVIGAAKKLLPTFNEHEKGSMHEKLRRKFVGVCAWHV